MGCVDDFRLRFGKRELVPIVCGGMGVDISTAGLALEVARLGGIGHISDAMVQTVSDRRFQTQFVKEKAKLYKYNVANTDKSTVLFDLGRLAEATHMHVGRTMEAKRGAGMIFVNCMEKLTMNAPRETLRVRLTAALDAGIDGITLSAGLHLGSFALIEDHPRFRDAKLGIIVSSLRALQLFLRKNARLDRLPDYIVVEGPLAGGHLGFGADDWDKHDLRAIVAEIARYLQAEELDIPLIPAGGIFTGSDAVSYLENGAAAVQVATRFTVTQRMRTAGQDQAGVLQGHRGGGRGEHDLAHRLPDADADRQPGDRRRHPAELRGLRLPARQHGQLRLHQRLQPRGGEPPGGQEDLGEGQDLPVHAHAQFRLLDMRALRLPAQGHLTPPARRQLPGPQRRTRLSRLSVQRRPQGRATRVNYAGRPMAVLPAHPVRIQSPALIQSPRERSRPHPA